MLAGGTTTVVVGGSELTGDGMGAGLGTWIFVAPPPMPPTGGTLDCMAGLEGELLI